jgi:hypothetical protein
MGRRGASYHVRGRHPAKAFDRVGTPCVVLASNRSWTSFAPLGDPPAGDLLSRTLDAPVVEIWSDDDAGTTLEFFAPDGWCAQLPIPLGVEPEPPGPAARQLLAHLAKAGIVTRARGAKLAAQLGRGPRDAWLEDNGVERLLGVPFADPLPVPLSEPLLRRLGISAKIVQPARQAERPARTKAKTKARAKANTKRAMPSAAGSTIDAHVLALHVHYWSELFQMNGWKLYNRYRKHLPAERRREVDQLCNRVAMGSDSAEVQRAVEQILATIWTADDWEAAIRDPELVAVEPLDASQRAEWQRRLATP